MRIVIDGTSLLLPSAGVKNYVHYWILSLLKAVQARGDGESLTIYPPGTRLPAVIDHQQVSDGSFGDWLRLRRVHLNNIRRSPFLSWSLRNADVFHCSQHLANIPKHTTSSATVFDLSCWTAPQTHTAANIAATRRYADRILRACAGLIAISAYTRNDTRDILGIPEDRIRVIYPGVAEAFFHVTQEQVRQARAAFRLEGPYLLFVGCIEPRKNVANMIRAYKRSSGSLRRDVRLVVAGPFGWASDDVRALLLQTGSEVHYLGYVPEGDLPGLVGGAECLIYPSYYEGFGFPVAQAMAAAVPVVTSNRSCLPEVLGDAGLLVDPDDVDEISAAMEQILTNADLGRVMGARGRTRAEAFRWSACAAQSLEFFHDLHSGR